MIIKQREIEVNLFGLFESNTHKPPFPLDGWIERRINQDIENQAVWGGPRMFKDGRILFVKHACVHPPHDYPHYSISIACEDYCGEKVVVSWPYRKSVKPETTPLWLWESLSDLNGLKVPSKEFE